MSLHFTEKIFKTLSNIYDEAFVLKTVTLFSQKVSSLQEKCSNTHFFSGQCFPKFGLYTEIYRVNLRIQSKYRKIRARENSEFGHFSRGGIYLIKFDTSLLMLSNNKQNKLGKEKWELQWVLVDYY